MTIKEKSLALIDELKATCKNYGMGNDGNEYKIITQVFLYKFLNDKFGYEIKHINHPVAERMVNAKHWELEYASLSEEERQMVFIFMSPDILKLNPEHLIYNLWNKQQKGDFDIIFDSTMVDIAMRNIDVFYTQTDQNSKIPLFEKLTPFITDEDKRAPFARALVDKLVNFSFEEAFAEHYDFFASIFEYLIKDYNTAGGGKYAEYYTPHAIATIMARLLIDKQENLHSIECYDPSAGTGTLLMALAHQIGEDRCTIFSQDISQRSNKMLKLNLLLNNLVSSLDHAIQGDTLVNPYHKSNDGKELRKFDYIVSNPPFNSDFSETREQVASMPVRFWAGVPSVPPKKKESMAIYTCFIQHVINSMKDNGRAAIVVPTPFLTKGKGIEAIIRKRIIDDGLLYGVITMPNNIFANTGTNVTVLFLHKSKSKEENVMFIEASILGSKSKESERNQKTVLSFEEQERIVNTFSNKIADNGFSAFVSYSTIVNNDYRLSPSTYFQHNIEFEEQSECEYYNYLHKKSDALKLFFSKELEDISSALFNHWFVQFDFPTAIGPYKTSGGKMEYNDKLDTMIPEGWEVKKITDICSIVDCLHSKKPEFIKENEDQYLLTLDNITPEGRIDITDKYYISERDYKMWSAKIEIHSRDFVITNAGRAGAIAMIPDGISCAIGRNMTAIRTTDISSTYFRQFLMSPYMDKFLAANLDESSFFKSFNVKSIKKIYVLIPPKEIINNYLKIASPILEKILNGIVSAEETKIIKELLDISLVF